MRAVRSLPLLLPHGRVCVKHRDDDSTCPRITRGEGQRSWLVLLTSGCSGCPLGWVTAAAALVWPQCSGAQEQRAEGKPCLIFAEIPLRHVRSELVQWVGKSPTSDLWTVERQQNHRGKATNVDL